MAIEAADLHPLVRSRNFPMGLLEGANTAMVLSNAPGVSFAFLPADIVTQILNFGLPAPIDIQVIGRDLEGDHAWANEVLRDIRTVPGTADMRIQQPFNEPYLNLRIERTKSQELGFSARDIAQNLLISLSGSFQTSPTFWVDPKTGVSYNIESQTPQYNADTLQDLVNIPSSDDSAPLMCIETGL